MKDVATKARRGRLTALQTIRRERVNLFADCDNPAETGMHSVIAQLSDVRVRMGGARMPFRPLTDDFVEPVRLR